MARGTLIVLVLIAGVSGLAAQTLRKVVAKLEEQVVEMHSGVDRFCVSETDVDARRSKLT